MIVRVRELLEPKVGVRKQGTPTEVLDWLRGRQPGPYEENMLEWWDGKSLIDGKPYWKLLSPSHLRVLVARAPNPREVR